MRKKNQKQLPLTTSGIDHPHAAELQGISRILDENPIISEIALQDLTRHVRNRDAGAEGMSADQVVRAAIIKQMEGYSYEELAFHLADSRCFRSFCRIGIAHDGYKKSALNRNIKAVSPESWEKINRNLVRYGEGEKIEKGREIRIDCTVVESDIRKPGDSALLWDCVRVLTRMLRRIRDQFPDSGIRFTDHTRRAKRRMLGIGNAKNDAARKKLYKDLLKVAADTSGYAENAVNRLEKQSHGSPDFLSALSRIEKLQEIIQLTQGVMDQTARRILHGETVPASEKIFSIFETHTDIIIKDRRDKYYGHKICLSGGASNLITDCLILEGNPADTSLTETMLDRHRDIYDRYPLKVALDGGFASGDNLEKAKTRGIKDVCFAKKRNLKEADMCRSVNVYRRLRRFRAGIEAGISWLKRCFGLDRCTWKSHRSFKSYVWASIVSANLLTLVRKQIA